MRTPGRFRKLVVRALIVTTTSALLPAPARADVAAQLEAHAVKPGDAKAQVAPLSESPVSTRDAVDEAQSPSPW